MKQLFYMILPLVIIVVCLFAGVRLSMTLVTTRWLCVALSIPVSIALFVLVFKLICRNQKTTMSVAELEALWQEYQLSDWDQIKTEIDNGAQIVRDTSSPLSWRMLWGHELVYLERDGKKIRTLFKRQS